MDQKSFQELLFKALKNRNTVVTLIAAGQIDSLTEICFSPNYKSYSFETMITSVDDVNSDKTKLLEEFIFHSVLLDCFTAKLDE